MMLGNLNDAPEWATHYVERVDIEEDVYWFVNFNNYRWTCFNKPDEEYTNSSAEGLVTEDIPENPDGYLIIELSVSLENE